MSYYLRLRAAFFMLALLVCIAQPCVGQTEKTQTAQPPAAKPVFKGYTVVQYSLRQKGKHFPVEITYTTVGGLPLDILLKQVGLHNYSPKIVTAVRLGWYAIVWEERMDLRIANPEIVLSGQTPVINLTALSQNERCDVAMTSIQGGLAQAEKKVETGFPLLSLNDVKSLTLDGTLKTLKERYAFIVYVNEVLFADGTMWHAKGKPPKPEEAMEGK
jgi:hypothetical protein